jgi:hypothetical protein
MVEKTQIDEGAEILESYFQRGLDHLKEVFFGIDFLTEPDRTVVTQVHRQGPLVIIDEFGSYPSNLDQIIKDQAEYYGKK